MRLLLLHEKSFDLEQEFERYRDLRNRLDLIHGDSGGRPLPEAGEIANESDVKGLVELLRHVLCLDGQNYG